MPTVEIELFRRAPGDDKAVGFYASSAAHAKRGELDRMRLARARAEFRALNENTLETYRRWLDRDLWFDLITDDGVLPDTVRTSLLHAFTAHLIDDFRVWSRPDGQELMCVGMICRVDNNPDDLIPIACWGWSLLAPDKVEDQLRARKFFKSEPIRP